MTHYFSTISCQETSSDVASPTASALTHDVGPPRGKRMKLDN